MTGPRLRVLALGLALVAPVLAPAFEGAGGSAACAAGRHHAALVVATGAKTTTYCVALTATTVSGLRLIELAAAQYGLEYRFGFGGQAVCELNGVGAAGGDCFGDYPNYWGYWHGTGSGGWTWAGSGAGSSSVGDGDVDGWSWGAGDSGSTHPPPPHVGFTGVCSVASPSAMPKPTQPPAPTPPPTPSRAPSREPSPPAARSSAPATSHPRRSPRASHVPPTSSASPVIVRAVATSGTTPSSGGPAAGAFAAIAVVLVLGVAGWVRLRRTEGRSP